MKTPYKTVLKLGRLKISLFFLLLYPCYVEAQDTIFVIRDANQRGNLDTLLYVAEVDKNSPKDLSFAQTLNFKPFQFSQNNYSTNKNYWTKISL